MMSDPVIVVRRVKKSKGKGGHGSSSWKIAFADFTLSMMAVFLVLWVVSMSTVEERREISKYFQDPGGLFQDPGSPDPISLGGNTKGGNSRLDLMMSDRVNEEEQSPLWTIFEDLHDAGLKAVLDKFRGNLELEYLPQGVRIMIVENGHHAMFERGGVNLTPYFEDLLLNLSPYLSKTGRTLSITGHADSTHFSQKSNSDNWLLSATRANEARRVMVYGGFPEKRIIQVTAMADTIPMDPENPYSSRNRRVEIMVLTRESERLIEGLLSSNRQRSQGASLQPADLETAHSSARNNQLDITM